MKIFFYALLSIIIFSACADENLPQKGNSEYIQEINDWHSNRIENLKKESGWLNLVGLYWLDKGENRFGSNPSNKIVFPDNAADVFGSIYLADSSVSVKILDQVEVTSGGNRVSELNLKTDMDGKPTVLEYKSLRWFIIKRGERYGIRLRDLEAELLTSFSGIDRFPVNEDWRIKGTFLKYDPPKKISIPTILGTIEEEFSPGQVVFQIEGINYSLDPVSAGKGLFIVFADQTNGAETYGGGRFLYISEIDSLNNVWIDFNKAYNPPCAFTRFATCPMPPKQNQLSLRITAGEKSYGKGH